ncbi:MDR family MFS transporter [Paractinoplanes globisporus]|uniref:MDR family MFS transporter n=1 Tax=Paractinoplanes globisporus TaxID=113565 RepID=A0ABW6WSB6_9ACTN|nr:MDR family MFS transporter [Actinoplanes globisporus]
MAALDRAVLKLSAIVVAGTITAMLDMTMVTVALAGMTRAFGAPITTVQWVTAAYLLTIAMVIPVTGRLAERFGARTMWLTALGVFVAGSALCGTAWSAPSLIAFRIVQGIGGGMIVPLGIMMLARAAGPGRRGRVMAIAAVPAQLAPIAGPLLGGLIVDTAGWRWIFFVNVPIGLLAILLSARGLPAGERHPGRRIDLAGLALLSPAIALLVFGLSRTAALPVAAGLVLLAAFLTHSWRTPGAPLIDIRVFRHRAPSAAAALNFVSRFSIFGASLLIPLYYQQVRGYDALTAGLLMAPQSLGTLLALPIVGRLTDRVGARPVVLAGIAATGLAALAYTQVGAGTPGPLLAAALLVWGIGIAAVAVPVSAAAYHGLSPAEIPNATSAITMIQTVGASAGAAVLTAILASRAAGAPAFAYAFWWVLGFGLLALIPALVLPLREAPVPAEV